MLLIYSTCNYRPHVMYTRHTDIKTKQVSLDKQMTTREEHLKEVSEFGGSRYSYGWIAASFLKYRMSFATPLATGVAITVKGL